MVEMDVSQYLEEGGACGRDGCEAVSGRRPVV